MTAPETIDQYIAQFPDEVVVLLQQVRTAISEAAPSASECINYSMPTFRLNGNLVHFAAYKKHIGFYPSPSGISAFQVEITKYKWAKGSVQFPLHEPIPLDLIRRITQFRVKENTETKN